MKNMDYFLMLVQSIMGATDNTLGPVKGVAGRGRVFMARILAQQP